jgi:IS30 family transposase
LKYRHLTIEERYQIDALRKVGYLQKDIAKEIGVDASTISRELKRNSSTKRKIYTAKVANKTAKYRRKIFCSTNNLKIIGELKKLIEKYIKEDFSPEQTSAVIKNRHNSGISFVRIYHFIEQDKQKGGSLHTHLRFYHTGKRRAKYGAKYKGKIEDRVSISQRPDEVNDKTRIGDWEMDTIIGANQQGAITTIVERVSIFSKISIPTSKKAIDIEKEATRILAPLKNKVLTITSDNGFEFSNHKNISKTLDCDYYFCHPYSSWERGLNEYTNGLIRQYIPKGTSFKSVTKKQIQAIENKLNHRPRKSLGWKTPHEVFYGIKMAC